MKKWVALCSVLCLCAYNVDAFAAAARTTKQSAVQKGTKVRTKAETTGLYDQECYDLYYGCMDQFCITDNANGGSCGCSDKSIALDQEFEKIKETLAEAERIKTVEVEKVRAGANADIIFGGERKYDKDGNVIKVDVNTEDEEKAQKRQDLMALFDSNVYDEDDEEGAVTDIADMTGDMLHSAAQEVCLAQIPDKCEKDLNLLKQMYSRQILSDCKAYENLIETKSGEAEVAMLDAETEVRSALKDSFNEANKFDRGTCMVEFKKCMQTEDACGEDWGNCVSIIASENMQNQTAASTAGTKVKTVDKYDITASTMEILESKRNICEKVLNQCMAVRDL